MRGKQRTTDLVLIVLDRKEPIARYPIADVPQSAKRELFKILFAPTTPLSGDVSGRLCVWAKYVLASDKAHRLIREYLSTQAGRGYMISVEVSRRHP